MVKETIKQMKVRMENLKHYKTKHGIGTAESHDAETKIKRLSNMIRREEYKIEKQLGTGGTAFTKGKNKSGTKTHIHMLSGKRRSNIKNYNIEEEERL
jgi:hypothetical protein